VDFEYGEVANQKTFGGIDNARLCAFHCAAGESRYERCSAVTNGLTNTVAHARGETAESSAEIVLVGI
jgi:hypothetical protein